MERHAASGTAWEEMRRDQKLKSCRMMVCSISLCEFGTVLQWLAQGEEQWQKKHKHLLVGTALPCLRQLTVKGKASTRWKISPELAGKWKGFGMYSET